VFKKILLFGSLLIAGMGVGLFGGWQISSFRSARERHAFEIAEGPDFVKAYEAMARLKLADTGTATRLQDPKKNADARREYLQLTLDTASKARAGVTDPRVLTLINVETGINYVRLAMVEEAAGNLSTSQTWMQKAQATLKEAGWQDCSEAHLRDLVQKLNQRDAL
jgi:hypothetical protein